MALPHTSLEPEFLSEPARKALAPGPVRMMAARGLAPLPRAADLITVVYQLALDADPAVREAASKTSQTLPAKVLSGALADPALDPRVLDFFAPRVLSEPTLFGILLGNPKTADETLAALAPKLAQEELDTLAQNEQRLLRHPALVAGLYMNPNARMSTVDRAVELAVRNDIQVPGIPCWEQVVAAVLGLEPPADPVAAAAQADAIWNSSTQRALRDDDEEARQVLAAAAKLADQPIDPDAPQPESDAVETERQLPIERLPIAQKLRLAQVGNAFARSVLIADRNKLVAMSVIKSPQITDVEVVKYAGSKVLSDEVIGYIAAKREWTKGYPVKVALVNNPKTPLKTAMTFVPFLNDRDMKMLSRAKSIPSALKNQVKALLTAKQGGGKKK